MRKSATLDRFAAYFDVGAATLRPVSSSSWDDVTPAQLTAVMEPGVCDPERVPTVSSDTFPGVPTSPAMEQAARRRYLLKPVRAFATYERKGKREALDSNAPAQRVHLRIDAVATRLTSSHLRAAFIAAERLERDARRAPHAHLRPTSAILSAEGSGAGSGAREWWRFAVAATTLRARREGTVPADRSTGGHDARAATVRGGVRRARRVSRETEKKEGRVGGTVARARPRREDARPRRCREGCAGARLRVVSRARARPGETRRRRKIRLDRRRGGRRGEVARARGGWFGGWFARSRSSTPNDDDASCDAADDPDLDPDAEMSEEDWAQLRRVFDVEGHTSAASKAFEVANDALQMETTVRIDAASFELDDDDEEASTTVLRASVSGLLAARDRTPKRSDHRATLAAIDVHVDGARLVRASGARRSTNVSESARGSIAADETAEALWGDVANGDAERRRRRRRIRKYRGRGGVRVRGDVDGRCGRERYASPVFRRARPSFGRASSWSRDKTHGSGCAGRHRLRLGGARARHRAQVADRSSGGGADTTQTCAVGGTGGAAQTSGGGGGEPTGHRRARAAARRARRSTRRGRHRRRPRAARRRAVGQHRIRPSDRVRGPRSGSTPGAAPPSNSARRRRRPSSSTRSKFPSPTYPPPSRRDRGIRLRRGARRRSRTPRRSSPRSARTRRFSRRSRPCRDTPRRR